jgi:soluble lytic murein transglycosylase-like protein
VSQVQSRILEIQSRFLPSTASTRSGDWASAAAAAGLGATSATSSDSSPVTASESAVVSQAQKYIGVPYVWGGTDGSKGLDCSGLSQLVYKNLGIDLPRTASQQATAGRPVASLAQARPGDLVFFDYSASRAGVDHVGVYIGGGKMIAAPQEGESVKIQDVGNPTVIRRVLPDQTPAASSPSGSALGGVPYADLFTRAGNRYGIDPSILAAMASQESGFNAGAVSAAGAQGLMQFMPGTARSLGINPLDPSQAIDGAARMLADGNRQFGSWGLALAAYNAGPNAVKRYGGVPPYKETQAYVPKVLALAGLS